MSRELVTQLKPVFDHHLAKHVTFRNLSRADAFPLFQATRHPDFNRFLLWVAPVQESDIMPQVDKLVREGALGNAVVLSICEKDTAAWLGLAIIKPFRDGLELSLYLHPSTWNKGIVFTTGRAVIEVMMQNSPGTPIYSRVHPGNRRMKKIFSHYHFEAVEGEAAVHDAHGQLELEVYLLNQTAWQPFTEVRSY